MSIPRPIKSHGLLRIEDLRGGRVERMLCGLVFLQGQRGSVPWDMVTCANCGIAAARRLRADAIVDELLCQGLPPARATELRAELLRLRGEGRIKS